MPKQIPCACGIHTVVVAQVVNNYHDCHFYGGEQPNPPKPERSNAANGFWRVVILGLLAVSSLVRTAFGG